MGDRRYPRLSIRGPVTLFVIVLVLIVTLTVLWNVALVQDYQKLRALAQATAFHWTFIALGSALFVTIIVLSSILGAQLINQIRWSQRQSNFIASVSHELNSPLSSIKLFAQTLRSNELSSSDRLDFVGRILFDVERLHRLIANILRAAEMDYRSDDLQVVPQRTELSAYLQRYLADTRPVYAASELQLTVPTDGEFWTWIDPLMFRQVLDNLIDNAVRYRGDQKPVVDLSVADADDGIQLTVRDHGIGISASELPKLFDRFYRIEQLQPSHKKRGTGIGLYIVRSIIRAHGGRVMAHSDGQGSGTTISIVLPAAGRSAAVEPSTTEVAA